MAAQKRCGRGTSLSDEFLDLFLRGFTGAHETEADPDASWRVYAGFSGTGESGCGSFENRLRLEEKIPGEHYRHRENEPHRGEQDGMDDPGSL